MEEKYFMHRIQEENGEFTTGIEVHDSLDAAKLSFWGRMKLGFNNPQKPDLTLVSCKITDNTGSTIKPYDMSWQKESEDEIVNTFFLHYIRKEGDTFTKAIDVVENFDTARSAFAAQMEYGYNNNKYQNVSFVSCEITNRSGFVLDPFRETWVKPEEE